MNSQISYSPSQTQKIGKSFALDIKRKKSGALVIVLDGDLGAGKTTLTQGFAKALGIKERVVSPTFVLMKQFKINQKGFEMFYHLDCYRIAKPKEILALGFKEIISDSKNIVLIEWAQNIKRYLPKDKVVIKLDFVDEKTRIISIP